MSAGATGVLCLGEALVDLICEQALDGRADLPIRPDRRVSFVPHFGGAVANVALLAAREGAAVSLAGGVGDDVWGSWLRDQLVAAGVGIEWFVLLEGLKTPVALTTVDEDGEAAYSVYGESLGTVDRVLGEEGAVERVVAGCTALFLSSNTLVGSAERAVTHQVREAALGAGRPILFDPNLRLGRWDSPAEAVEAALACVPGALLVRCNALEARLISGQADLERAAEVLLGAGACNVVISLGARGAILRGAYAQDVPGVPASVISTIGAGDAMTAMLVARLAAADFYEPMLAAALRDAVVAGAEACERWGAID
jgi:fructokinase